MIDVYEGHGGGNVVAVEEVPWEHVSRYGVVGAKDWQDNAFTITGMVEKPKRREDAPSNLIISGRYILEPQIFAEIEKQEGRRRRDPDHRRDDPPDGETALLWPAISRNNL
jgi:UTP--glucose-1-phosphate uridylyltransferase